LRRISQLSTMTHVVGKTGTHVIGRVQQGFRAG
jgi:hypothetical protein